MKKYAFILSALSLLLTGTQAQAQDGCCCTSCVCPQGPQGPQGAQTIGPQGIQGAIGQQGPCCQNPSSLVSVLNAYSTSDQNLDSLQV